MAGEKEKRPSERGNFFLFRELWFDLNLIISRIILENLLISDVYSLFRHLVSTHRFWWALFFFRLEDHLEIQTLDYLIININLY